MTERQRATPSHVALAQLLGFQIVNGDRQPGETLPNEIDLAAQMNVSRSVIREALRILLAKGLLRSRPKAGTQILPRRHWNMLDPDLLRWMFDRAPPLPFVRNLFELRMIVEPAAAGLAAERRTAHQLAQLGHAIEEMAAHGLATDPGRAADQAFHGILLEATGNELIVNLSAGIAAAVRWTTYFKYRGSRHPRDPLPQHRVLFEAVAGQDIAGARTAAEELIQQAALDTEMAIEAIETIASRRPASAANASPIGGDSGRPRRARAPRSPSDPVDSGGRPVGTDVLG